MKTKTKETSSIKIYSEDDFKGLKKAGSLAARTLEYIEKLIKPGVKTNFIDGQICRRKLLNILSGLKN